ncbi:MAG TPA: sigma-70 family RNA polymerase sigma factor [Bacteroidales bacterium]|nr:sigma-70 family RNA polymerase sigma factor [Bacteroidales bacterium]
MENTLNNNQQLIADSYVKYRDVVHGYFRKRLVNDFEAEDLTQDVFIKLVTYAQMLRPDTVQYFIFTIARNLSIDYNRRFFKKLEIAQYLMNETDSCSNTTENEIAYNELVCIEQQALQSLPEQRGKVYQLSMYGEYTYKEMAEILDISPRTVEKHLFTGRADVRRYIAAVI